MPKYRDGSWDGYISLLRGFKIFPTGLLGIVTDTFDREGLVEFGVRAFIPSVIFNRSIRTICFLIPELIALREKEKTRKDKKGVVSNVCKL